MQDSQKTVGGTKRVFAPVNTGNMIRVSDQFGNFDYGKSYRFVWQAQDVANLLNGADSTVFKVRVRDGEVQAHFVNATDVNIATQLALQQHSSSASVASVSIPKNLNKK